MKRMVVWCVLAGHCLLRPVWRPLPQRLVLRHLVGNLRYPFRTARVVNDTAWLVLQQSGTTVTGTMGPKAEQQGPIRDGSTFGNDSNSLPTASKAKC